MFQPLRNNLIVLAFDDPDEWKYGSLVLARPESTKDRADQGIVKVVGPGVRDVQIGDHVMFSPYAGKVIDEPEEGKKMIMLSEDGIDAIITPASTLVSGLYMYDVGTGTHFPATAEAAMLLVREAVSSLPRIAEAKKRWRLATHV
jgi:co-chaperonin GroES (HSP10)